MCGTSSTTDNGKKNGTALALLPRKLNFRLWDEWYNAQRQKWRARKNVAQARIPFVCQLGRTVQRTQTNDGEFSYRESWVSAYFLIRLHKGLVLKSTFSIRSRVLCHISLLGSSTSVLVIWCTDVYAMHCICWVSWILLTIMVWFQPSISYWGSFRKRTVKYGFVRWSSDPVGNVIR